MVSITLFWPSCTPEDVDPCAEDPNHPLCDPIIEIDNPIVLECGDLDSDKVLENTDQAVDYLVTCGISVKGNIQIEPGTVIAFEDDTHFDISTGSLTAIGNMDEPIIFRGVESQKGYWSGLWFASNSANNQLEYVTIQDAGKDWIKCCDEPASVTVDDGQLRLKNVTMKNGGGIGLTLTGSATLVGLTDVVITTHDDYPIHTNVNHLTNFDGTGSDFSGNAKDFILVKTETLNTPITWKETNIPYLLEGGNMDIHDNLTIEAGVELNIREDGAFIVEEEGSLTIEGTSSKPVVIKGEQEAKGYWKGIWVETNSSKNSFENLELSDAGKTWIKCCDPSASIKLDDGQLALNNVTISNGQGHGIIANNAAVLSAYSNVTITSHGEEPLYIAPNRVAELDGMNSDYRGNAKDYIRLWHNDLTVESTWKQTNVPYLFESRTYKFKAGATIEAGTDIAFLDDGGLGIENGGYLRIEGNSSAMVKFRGKENVNGYWNGIYYRTTSGNNFIEFAEISNAGNTWVYCCPSENANIFVWDNANLTIQNSVISESAGCGIGVDSNGSLTESSNTFTNNLSGNICHE